MPLDLAVSFARIVARWRDVAPLDVLAPPAGARHLAKIEGDLGCRIPPGLRQLWSIHDGLIGSNEEGSNEEGHDVCPEKSPARAKAKKRR